MSYNRRANTYDVEYIEKRDYAFIESLLGNGTLRVLEVPCGAGRLSNRLVNRAARLTLVDMESAMVVRSAHACEGGRAEINTEIGDMRTLDLGSTFDIALVPREALQLLPPDEGRQAVSAIGAHVAPDGLLFIDIATFRSKNDPDYFDPERENTAWRCDWTRDLVDGCTLTRHSSQSDEGSSIAFRLAYEVNFPTGATDSWQSEMRLYRYERNWLDAVTPVGMVLKTVYGDYNCSSFSEKSPRMLALYHRSIA